VPDGGVRGVVAERPVAVAQAARPEFVVDAVDRVRVALGVLVVEVPAREAR